MNTSALICVYLWPKFYLPGWPEELAELLKELGELLEELGGFFWLSL
jgi:hypothetical protein